MVKIDRFSNFNIRTLYVFDFDDTIVVSPRYEDIALEYLSENLKVKDLIDRAIKSIGIEKPQLKFQDGRIFVEDPNNNYNQTKDWTRKGTRLYLIQPDEFCYLDESLPKKLKEVSDIYNQSKDKCIVTARPEGARDKIVSVLNKLNLKFPKYGLHMRPDFLKNAGVGKVKKL